MMSLGRSRRSLFWSKRLRDLGVIVRLDGDRAARGGLLTSVAASERTIRTFPEGDFVRSLEARGMDTQARRRRVRRNRLSVTDIRQYLVCPLFPCLVTSHHSLPHPRHALCPPLLTKYRWPFAQPLHTGPLQHFMKYGTSIMNDPQTMQHCSFLTWSANHFAPYPSAVAVKGSMRRKETGTRLEEGNWDAISIDGNPLLRRPSKRIAFWFPT